MLIYLAEDPRTRCVWVPSGDGDALKQMTSLLRRWGLATVTPSKIARYLPRCLKAAGLGVRSAADKWQQALLAQGSMRARIVSHHRLQGLIDGAPDALLTREDELVALASALGCEPCSLYASTPAQQALSAWGVVTDDGARRVICAPSSSSASSFVIMEAIPRRGHDLDYMRGLWQSMPPAQLLAAPGGACWDLERAWEAAAPWIKEDA